MGSGSRDFRISNQSRDASFVNYRSRGESEISVSHQATGLKSSRGIAPGSTVSE
jgi:hypothetical protein